MAHEGRLHLVRAERADRLVGALADLLAEPATDPLAAELVAVPTRGIERWLAQELSLRLGTAGGRADGVCANIAFPFPGTVVARALAAACGRDPGTDPWAPARLVWPLLETIDAHLAEGWLAPLRNHLGGPPGDRGPHVDPTRRLRRFGAVRHLADLYDRYGVHRPSMLLDWAAGRDVDGAGQALDGDVAWQPRLWRLVRERMKDTSPAERLDETVARLREGLAVPDLPKRMAVFGLTALPASFLRVLAALATHNEVHLFLLHPSPVLWDAVAGALEREGAAVVQRDQDPTRGLVTNPLLGSWGRDAREMQLVVAGAPAVDDRHVHADERTPATLLHRLQADVRADRLPAGVPLAGEGDRRPLLADDDRSVQVHACHGRSRQVEVLRDAILHVLAEDPTLQPRDILVMCPDIEAYAPIVQAVFDVPPATGGPDGLAGTGAPALPDVRVKLADRAIRQTNPVLRVVADLLERADGRLTASEVLDLASREPVRRRFRLDDDDLTRLESWVADAQIRWGLDGEHRAAFDLGGIAANTWRAGLDRILLGVTMADQDDRLVEGTAPLDDVEGTDVDLAGRLAELVDRLDEAIARLQGPQPITRWCAALASAADLLTATTEADRWQRIQLDRLFEALLDEAGAAGTDGPSQVDLALAEAALLLSDRLRGRPTRANHRTGDLTVCTLVPMRSVPHRVICLLGMDDGAFPRRTVPDGDDLIDRDPQVGDRDPRTEDRQLLLDALLAAADTLVVTYSGNDVRTNDPRPPAVPVGELLDVVDATVRTADGAPARGRVRVVHPLQPFDPRNFAPGMLGRDQPWGFDRNALDGARAKTIGGAREPRFLDGPLDRAGRDGTVALDDLVAFVQHPVRAFLRQRLDVTPPRPGEEPSDAIAVELDPLEQYALGERLLATRLAGADERRWAAAERARGVLPPGALADRALEGLRTDVEAIVTAVREVLDELGCDPESPRRRLAVEVALPEARVAGAVPGVVGDVIVRTQYARVGPKHRLAAWARLLAATTAAPDRAFCAVTIGRFHRSARSTKLVTVSRLGPLGETAQERADRSRAGLARLVDLYERGMREPLPLYCRTSAAYAEAVRAGKEPASARHQWVTTGQFPKEDVDPAHRLVLGGVLPFEGLLALPPCDDERGAGWFDEEPARVGRYARRLWDGLLDAEEVEHR